MTIATEQKRIADKLVAIWDASGCKYTCTRVIHDVIERPAQSMCYSSPAAVKPRRVINMATDIIHRREYPS